MDRFLIDGVEVKRDDEIYDFRGDIWVFCYLTRGGSRVYVRRLGSAWHQEFNPTVFKGVIAKDAGFTTEG